jgi:hypothetical protein
LNNILTTSTLFIISILLTGTIVVSSPSFMFEVHARSYQGIEKDRKQVGVSSLKCNNINVNVNGLELSVLPPFLGGEVAATAAEDNSGANSVAGNSDGFRINDFRFICINNNTNTVTGSGSNITEPNGTLEVTNTVICTPNDTSGPTTAACQFILNNILPNSFNITVTGNNPNPSKFTGSNEPVIVPLGAGDYEVIEETPVVLLPIPDVSVARITSFAGNCTVNPNDPASVEASGTIEAKESQTCDITNDYKPISFPPP